MLYFVRHGESASNARGEFSGRGENPKLTEKGRQQALAAARAIQEGGVRIDTIVSSPLNRTLETAKIISQTIGFDPTRIILDERIVEYDVGSYKGKPKKGVTSLQLTSAAGAEDPYLFRDRVQTCIKELAQLPGNVLLISHNGVGRMLEIIRTNGDPRLFYDGQEHGNAVVKELDWI